MSSVGRSSFLSSRRRPSAARTAVAMATALAVVGSGLVTVQVATPPARAAVGAATTSASAEKPDLVSARLAARLGGHRVEITGERTETATTFANPDGTLSTETAARPVRVRRDTGWVPADPTLVAAPGGVVSPRATAAGLALSGGGAGDLIRVTTGRSILALRWPRQLPAPTLSGATATYANVLPNVDLKVTADVEGFEQLLVVKARPSAPLGTIRIPLSLSGLSASQDAGGNLVFKDSSGAVVAVSPAPRMWGATRDAAGTEPTRSAPVRTALVTVGGAQELDLTPDAAFLADPTVTYPVTVDPAVTVARAHWTYVDKASDHQLLQQRGHRPGRHLERRYPGGPLDLHLRRVPVPRHACALGDPEHLRELGLLLHGRTGGSLGCRPDLDVDHLERPAGGLHQVDDGDHRQGLQLLLPGRRGVLHRHQPGTGLGEQRLQPRQLRAAGAQRDGERAVEEVQQQPDAVGDL